jgi:hypothetical protein
MNLMSEEMKSALMDPKERKKLEDALRGKGKKTPNVLDIPVGPVKGKKAGGMMKKKGYAMGGKMMKKGYKKGGKVRGAGMASKGVRPAKMVTMKGS